MSLEECQTKSFGMNLLLHAIFKKVFVTLLGPFIAPVVIWCLDIDSAPRELRLTNTLA